MKKSFIVFSIIGPFLLGISNQIKADDWTYWGLKNPQGGKPYEIYTINPETGTKTLRTTICELENNGNCATTPGSSYVDETTGEFYYHNIEGNWQAYNLESNTWTDKGPDWKGPYHATHTRPLIVEKEDGSIALEMNGEKILGKGSNGEVSLGKNSWYTKEEDGRQKVYAKDANGNPIPIDYTNGTKLLINGRDVEQSINNVGALSAALTGLPTVPTDTALACGLGTGTHGGDFAFSGGCASKVNEKLSFNYAASMTMPGQDYAGNFEDKFSARAGFVWQLGEASKPTQISFKQKKEIDLKISKLENDNELLKADNKELKTKNNEIISQNSKLLARLEKLENIAFKLKNNEVFKLSKGFEDKR